MLDTIAGLRTRAYGKARTEASTEAALRVLNQLAASSYGPAGRSKIIRANSASSIAITSVSHRLFTTLRIEQPVARVFLELLSSRHARGEDGGLFTVLLATELLLGAKESGLKGQHMASLLSDAMELCASFLRSSDCGVAVPLRIGELDSLIALVVSVLSPKWVALSSSKGIGSHNSEARRLALLVVSGVVQSLGEQDELACANGAAAIDAASSGGPEEHSSRLVPGVRQLVIIGSRRAPPSQAAPIAER